MLSWVFKIMRGFFSMLRKLTLIFFMLSSVCAQSYAFAGSQEETRRNVKVFQGHITHELTEISGNMKPFYYLTTIDDEKFILEIPSHLEAVAKIFKRRDVEVRGAFIRTKQTRDDAIQVVKVLNIRPI